MNRAAKFLLSLLYAFLCIGMFIVDDPVIVFRAGISAVLLSNLLNHD